MVSRLVQSALMVAVYVWFAAYFARAYGLEPAVLVRWPLLSAAIAGLLVMLLGSIAVIAVNSDRRP